MGEVVLEGRLLLQINHRKRAISDGWVERALYAAMLILKRYHTLTPRDVAASRPKAGYKTTSSVSRNLLSLLIVENF